MPKMFAFEIITLSVAASMVVPVTKNFFVPI